MKYSNIALEVLAAKECGLIKSNAQFWKNFHEIDLFRENTYKNSDFLKTLENLSYQFDGISNDGGFICIYDDEFPIINKNVKNSGDKPYLLFYKGNLTLLNNLNNNIAVIGLVDPDEEIMKRETEIVKQLVNKGLIIVSGLAKGCDTVAHKVCLEEYGKTIAILSTPIDRVYPATNKLLAKEIVNRNGLLLSEYYKEPYNRNEAIKRLIDRDRLQAMFAKAVILIASYQYGKGDSGSRHAMEAAKKFAVERYVMFNLKTDNINIKFGLNREYLLNTNDSINILQQSSIEYIKFLENKDLIKNKSDMLIEQLSIF